MTDCTCTQAGGTGEDEKPRCTRPAEDRLIEIDRHPYVGETPPEALASWLTPNSRFYVRNHFDTPRLEASSWRLKVEGLVKRPLSLTMDHLLSMPRRTLPMTMECAGNNRSDLSPSVPGNPFQRGAISTALWCGVPLGEVLREAGLREGAREVLFEGADAGEPEPGQAPTAYLRSLPLEVATHPDTLLAFEMNGEPLTPEHGYPLRLIVPGWYGMASVKWLCGIRVLDRPFEGFFQTDRYIMLGEGFRGEPVTRLLVKSFISWPREGSRLSPGPVHVMGMAWSGHGGITRVEFSDDGGRSWRDAQLLEPEHRYAWRQWSIRWEPPGPGTYRLASRAHDAAGNVQPATHRWNELGYGINGVRSISVTVTGMEP